MSSLTYEEASKAGGQVFKIEIETGTQVDVVLEEVVALGKRPMKGPQPPSGANIRTLPFNMFFRGTKGCLLSQGIYRLYNETLGEQEIFLIPVGYDPTSDEYRYHAGFN